MSKYINILALIVGAMILIGTAFTCASRAEAGNGQSFYSWVDDSKVLNFTEEAKHIPRKYKDRASIRRYSSIEVPITPVNVPEYDYRIHLMRRLALLQEVNVPQPRIEEACEGAVTVTQQWEKEGNLTRMIYYLKDACDKVLSRTYHLPRVYKGL